jgi:hypothetical protein
VSTPRLRELRPLDIVIKCSLKVVLIVVRQYGVAIENERMLKKTREEKREKK